MYKVCWKSKELNFFQLEFFKLFAISGKKFHIVNFRLWLVMQDIILYSIHLHYHKTSECLLKRQNCDYLTLISCIRIRKSWQKFSLEFFKTTEKFKICPESRKTNKLWYKIFTVQLYMNGKFISITNDLALLLRFAFWYFSGMTSMSDYVCLSSLLFLNEKHRSIVLVTSGRLHL